MQKPISILEVGTFLRQVSAFLNEEDLNELKWHLAQNPCDGVVIPGTGGIRKLRWSASGRGKRGGSRVIYFFHDDTMPIFLLAAYAKNAKSDLTEGEKTQLRRFVSVLIARYKPEAEK